jgi:predicted enzyme related to lactoylglutathione lyase
MGVTGIGGLFFRGKDPEALKRWYCEHLGVGCGEYGTWDQEAGTTVFSPFPSDTDYFPSDRQYMLNLRVEGIEELLEKLRSAGVEVITKPEWNDPAIGRFARIHDPEGNPIELWQPPES